MDIIKQTPIGDITIKLPFDIGDKFKIQFQNSIYIINKIIVIDANNIFIVNNYSGLWINIFEIESSTKTNGIYILKLKERKE